MIIYKLLNRINGKSYIGKTTKALSVRYYFHCYEAGKGSNHIIHKAIRKYGTEAFDLITLETLEEGVCINDREKFWIASEKPEYNMTIGGDGGDTSVHIDYSKYKWHGENNPMYGCRGADNPNFGKKRTEQQKLNSTLSDYVKSKSRPVEFEGVKYRSIKHACEVTGRSHKYIKRHGVMLSGAS